MVLTGELKMLNKEKAVLTELRNIQKCNENWENNIGRVGDKLNEKYTANIQSKALWIIGEMGLKYPLQVEPYIKKIAPYLKNSNPKLRERALNALGRIGRADKNLIIPYLGEIMKMRKDDVGDVRLAFVWACENIATNAPELFSENLEIYYELMSDSNERVRIEAPEMFRVVGKRKPESVKPYLEKLEFIAKNDEHPVVRVHCTGAVRITKNALEKSRAESNEKN